MPLTFPTGPADGDTHEYLGQTYKYAASDDAWRRQHAEYQVISHNHDERYYTEAQVDALLGAKSNTSHTHNYLPTSGGTLTGSLTLPGSPTAAQQAATKNYVDTQVASVTAGLSTGTGVSQNFTISGPVGGRYLYQHLDGNVYAAGTIPAGGTVTVSRPNSARWWWIAG